MENYNKLFRKYVYGELTDMNHNTHDNNFSFWHWAGLLMVILGHQYVLMGQQPPVVLNIEIQGLGVQILFAVSGFLVTGSLKKGNCKEFIIKRITRIMPGLIICILGIAFIIGPIFTNISLSEYFLYFKIFIYKNILLSPVFDLPGVFVENPYPVAVNGSLWTLPVEMACYLILPVLMWCYQWLFKRAKKAACVYITLISIIIYAGYFVRITGISISNCIIWGTDWANAFTLFIYFWLGSIFSWFNLKKYLSLQYAICGLLIYMALPSGIISAAVRPLAITYFVLALAFAAPPKLGRLIKLNCYYAGYLWAFPIQQCLIAYIIVRKQYYIPPFIMFLLSLILTLSIACFATNIEEKLRTASKCLINRIRKD